MTCVGQCSNQRLGFNLEVFSIYPMYKYIQDLHQHLRYLFKINPRLTPQLLIAWYSPNSHVSTNSMAQISNTSCVDIGTHSMGHINPGTLHRSATGSLRPGSPTLPKTSTSGSRRCRPEARMMAGYTNNTDLTAFNAVVSFGFFTKLVIEATNLGVSWRHKTN